MVNDSYRGDSIDIIIARKVYHGLSLEHHHEIDFSIIFVDRLTTPKNLHELQVYLVRQGLDEGKFDTHSRKIKISSFIKTFKVRDYNEDKIKLISQALLDDKIHFISELPYSIHLSPDKRFRDNGNGTLFDSLTELLWTERSNLFHSWSGVSSYVNELNLNPQLKWRIPTFAELESLYTKNENHWTLEGCCAENININVFIKLLIAPVVFRDEITENIYSFNFRSGRSKRLYDKDDTSFSKILNVLLVSGDFNSGEK